MRKRLCNVQYMDWIWDTYSCKKYFAHHIPINIYFALFAEQIEAFYHALDRVACIIVSFFTNISMLNIAKQCFFYILIYRKIFFQGLCFSYWYRGKHKLFLVAKLLYYYKCPSVRLSVRYVMGERDFHDP